MKVCKSCTNTIENNAGTEDLRRIVDKLAIKVWENFYKSYRQYNANQQIALIQRRKERGERERDCRVSLAIPVFTDVDFSASLESSVDRKYRYGFKFRYRKNSRTSDRGW